MASLAPSILTGEDVAFEHDIHAYLDHGGIRRMSVTQAIKIAGLIDYSMVAPEVLQYAADRGRLVHEGCAVIDRGDSLDELVIPDEVQPYIDAYLAFQREMKFIPDPDWIERPMIVEMFGHRVGMTPDAVGTIAGIPTVVERKATSSAHPAWAIQTAGYGLGLRAAGLQIRQRFAVQLFKTGKYKLHPHQDETDYESFGDVYRVAALKLKFRLATLD